MSRVLSCIVSLCRGIFEATVGARGEVCWISGGKCIIVRWFWAGRHIWCVYSAQAIKSGYIWFFGLIAVPGCLS